MIVLIFHKRPKSTIHVPLENPFSVTNHSLIRNDAVEGELKEGEAAKGLLRAQQTNPVQVATNSLNVVLLSRVQLS